ncbi:uncharacterized protein LOC126571468 isoform X3 [Anopheles aquasalis]|uniref:uncharacterized protein LOC126571468 isoform X1 n=1 Tax=Anopheles aquasalis TaxID=42839 RepID=UPI00215B2A0D|nr:uncharacterized protein LOC126571468 isoform X1 [Anopheles aquasalis]XP_050085960.1 uncharacterized protein LOC126571468 isoform X2 [Anopheles aquasalis]XP_050085968.1 uncharacterized protein LOC126571468 isoform X3 [Anopheles aquasalis]
MFAKSTPKTDQFKSKRCAFLLFARTGEKESDQCARALSNWQNLSSWHLGLQSSFRSGESSIIQPSRHQHENPSACFSFSIASCAAAASVAATMTFFVFDCKLCCCC